MIRRGRAPCHTFLDKAYACDTKPTQKRRIRILQFVAFGFCTETVISAEIGHFFYLDRGVILSLILQVS